MHRSMLVVGLCAIVLCLSSVSGNSAPVPPEEMVFVPAGPFTMGSNIGDTDESPEHLATTKAYFMDKYEVSNADFKKFESAYTYKDGYDNHACVVTWEQAAAYAKWAGKRLPTEEEWEKAARGTDARLYPWGDSYDVTFVAYDGDVPRGGTIMKAASPYGCFDMAGGVREWTDSWYKPYAGNDVACESYGEQFKVCRGGSHFCDPFSFRSSHRFYLPANTTGNYYTGFRCVKDAE
ncbi:MAG: SUMF1/EgtB/PvdO family nonheme iron enzyme [Candidatus Hydrogenedentes bacterium]|nr:SUMF1/EgtB/PvdO family nonheme iron enzyme [Candidatus Hydrogenedentota bacterium]